MRRELVLFAALALGSCGSDPAKDLNVCQTQADRFYQGYSDSDADNPRGKYIIACMAAKNYEFNLSAADCDSRHPLTIQPACYAPTSWLTQLIR